MGPNECLKVQWLGNKVLISYICVSETLLISLKPPFCLHLCIYMLVRTYISTYKHIHTTYITHVWIHIHKNKAKILYVCCSLLRHKAYIYALIWFVWLTLLYRDQITHNNGMSLFLLTSQNHRDTDTFHHYYWSQIRPGCWWALWHFIHTGSPTWIILRVSNNGGYLCHWHDECSNALRNASLWR